MVREVGAAVGLGSSSSVAHHLKALAWVIHGDHQLVGPTGV
jgi:hypothetical protein